MLSCSAWVGDWLPVCAVCAVPTPGFGVVIQQPCGVCSCVIGSVTEPTGGLTGWGCVGQTATGCRLQSL